ncbi:MAG: NADH-quinone oxidoreductase subunit J [Pirellulales bacterium]|nr:NADH-quinone oxidoreductase subunit J [Pirellulales bacterium]
MDPTRIMLLAALMNGAGLWLLLPQTGSFPFRRPLNRTLGTLLGSAGLGLMASQLPGLGEWFSGSVFWGSVFWILAGVTVVAAAAAVVSRDPVYSALWFGLMLLGTAGLFLFSGAAFLAVATVTVYAGAILVTFLFVLMLAQPEGRAGYDRTSTEALLSAVTGSMIVALLSIVLGRVLGLPEAIAISSAATGGTGPTPDVARLGTVLFSRYLIAVEVAGVLLLTALVGAAAILARRNKCPCEDQTTANQMDSPTEGAA